MSELPCAYVSKRDFVQTHMKISKEPVLSGTHFHTSFYAAQIDYVGHGLRKGPYRPFPSQYLAPSGLKTSLGANSYENELRTYRRNGF